MVKLGLLYLHIIASVGFSEFHVIDALSEHQLLLTTVTCNDHLLLWHADIKQAHITGKLEGKTGDNSCTSEVCVTTDFTIAGFNQVLSVVISRKQCNICHRSGLVARFSKVKIIKTCCNTCRVCCTFHIQTKQTWPKIQLIIGLSCLFLEIHLRITIFCDIQTISYHIPYRWLQAWRLFKVMIECERRNGTYITRYCWPFMCGYAFNR